MTGPRRFEIERFLVNYGRTHNVTRAAVPWLDIRDHISAQFLNVDEAAALRREVEDLCQSAYEAEVSHARRFREIADVAYQEARRNTDHEPTLARFFEKGLLSSALACKPVENIHPITLNAFITAVTLMDERKGAYSRL